MVETKEENTRKFPTWINAEFFKDILAADVPDHVQVKSVRPDMALPPGENYASLMLRIHLDLEMRDGSTQPKTYVLKTMLDDDKGGQAITEMSLFPKEVLMYEKYLPAFEALYKAAGWEIQLAPRCLMHELNGKRMNLVFEDLREKGFGNVDRLQGLDMAHMRRTLRKLAEFHAASAVYADEQGKYPKEYDLGFAGDERQDEFQRLMFSTKVNAYKKAMGMWGLEEADKYIEKFPTYEQYMKCGRRTNDTSKNVFNVLTHGDFWSSNVMQNYHANGDINEMLLVDFQFCKWGSPAEDLLFFITISAAPDVRMREYEHFVEIYHDRLVECLKVLQYKQRLPKLREMQMEMYQEHTSFYAFFALFNHLPLLLMPSDKNANIDVLMRADPEAEAFRVRIFTNPALAAAMRDLFPFYHRRGLFNFDDYE